MTRLRFALTIIKRQTGRRWPH
ncbi:hypothetical protein F6Y05_02250 [Bacillus megaterium]|nr:hypothetical protein [Priestia megaterium]